MIINVVNEYTALDSFNDLFKYTDYVLESNKSDLYINECITLLTEGISLTDIEVIQEKVISNIKATVQKLIEAIAGIWAKFVQKVTSFVKGDEEYLKKYKDVILGKPLKEDKYTMYTYWDGMFAIINTKVPAFNYVAMKDSLESEDTFLKKYFNEFVPKDEGTSYVELAKEKFRGPKKEIDTKQIDMNTLYSFCIDYEKLVDRFKADITQIDRAGKECINIIDKMDTGVEESYITGRYIYSYFTEEYIYEEELIKKASDEKPKTAEDKNRISSNIKNVDGEAKNDEKEIKDRVKADGGNKEDDYERIKLYMRVGAGILGAKMAVAQETYKAYMIIIKDHVKSYAGSSKNDKNDNTAKQKEKNTTDDKKQSGGFKGILDAANKKLQGSK